MNSEVNEIPVDEVIADKTINRSDVAILGRFESNSLEKSPYRYMGCFACKKIFGVLLETIRHRKNQVINASKLMCFVIPKRMVERKERCENVIEKVKNTVLDWVAEDIQILHSMCGLANLC